MQAIAAFTERLYTQLNSAFSGFYSLEIVIIRLKPSYGGTSPASTQAGAQPRSAA